MKLNPKKSTNTDVDDTFRSKTGVKDKQRKNNIIGPTTPKTKIDGSVRKETTVFKTNKYVAKKSINKSNFDFDGDQTEGESFSSEKVPNSFDVRIEKIIPEILRLQFFQTRHLDNSDCLLEVCEKYLRRYKDHKKGELRNEDGIDLQLKKHKENCEVQSDDKLQYFIFIPLLLLLNEA